MVHRCLWLSLAVITREATFAWIPAFRLAHRHSMTTTGSSLGAQVGIFFGTSTGSTQTAADLIHQAFGPEVSSEPVDIDTVEAGDLAQVFAEYDALVVGTPTWNTGADSERSGTGWDELYYTKLPELKDIMKAKKVAVFGLGDQSSFAENYADASGELFDVFCEMGCTMLGSWSQEGYEHEDSKAIRGEKFCGLMLDFVNQEELSEERVRRWVAQLKEEGILGLDSGVALAVATDGIVAGISSTADSPAALDAQKVNGQKASVSETLSESSSSLEKELTTGSALMDATIANHSMGGFIAHTNHLTRKTMWTSADGRKSFVTTERTITGLTP
ncbi:hypothetical protein MPSEU_000513500 [Mayamaea pseudoterrestris]|nr:hypothetical protein MPSEU_000513500 [Mayamaea pseudoterrestris]